MSPCLRHVETGLQPPPTYCERMLLRISAFLQSLSVEIHSFEAPNRALLRERPAVAH